jgi:hypothetical protein
MKYLGDPVSKLVYTKNELCYFYSKHYAKKNENLGNQMQDLVKTMLKIFELVEKNLVKTDKMRIYKIRR